MVRKLLGGGRGSGDISVVVDGWCGDRECGFGRFVLLWRCGLDCLSRVSCLWLSGLFIVLLDVLL